MNAILEFRKTHGLTQRQLARRWRLSQPVISQVEQGLRPIRPVDAIRISKRTGIPLAQLIVTQREVSK